MKKIILYSLITAMMLSGTTTAFAVETQPNPATDVRPRVTVPKPTIKTLMEDKRNTRATTTGEMRDKTQDLRAKMASTSRKYGDDRMENRRELIKNMIEKRFKKMFRRFQSTIEREVMIMGKINARITKVKTAGGNTTEAEKYTLEAKTNLDLAQTSLDLLIATATSTGEIDAQLLASSTSPGTITKDTLQKMKIAADQIEKYLKEAHKALEKAVKSLRGMSRVNNNASTTPPTTSTTTTNN